MSLLLCLCHFSLNLPFWGKLEQAAPILVGQALFVLREKRRGWEHGWEVQGLWPGREGTCWDLLPITPPLPCSSFKVLNFGNVSLRKKRV